MTMTKPSTKVSSQEAVKCGRTKLTANANATIRFDLASSADGVPRMTAVDGCLQSTGSKRRYMRRGSKCPSMILKAMQKEIADERSFATVPKLSDCQQRRLSLMTALKVSLEKVSIIDRMPEKKREEPMSVEEICRCTYDLLTEASEL